MNHDLHLLEETIQNDWSRPELNAKTYDNRIPMLKDGLVVFDVIF